MKNRIIKHLFMCTNKGRFFVPTDLQTPLNMALLAANKDAVEVFSRLGRILSRKYWNSINQMIENSPENTLKHQCGLPVMITGGDFEGYTGVIHSHQLGAKGFSYCIELDDANGCKYVTGVTDNDIELI